MDKPHPDDQKSKGKKTIRQSKNYAKSKSKDYAIKHGILRGAYGGLFDEVAVDIDIPVDVSLSDMAKPRALPFSREAILSANHPKVVRTLPVSQLGKNTLCKWPYL